MGVEDTKNLKEKGNNYQKSLWDSERNRSKELELASVNSKDSRDWGIWKISWEMFEKWKNPHLLASALAVKQEIRSLVQGID